MQDRTPYDGRPFYCVRCDAGLGEYMACESPDCALETVARARARQQRKARASRQAAATSTARGKQCDT